MKKLLKIFIVIFAVTAVFFVSFVIRNRVLDNKIKKLTDTYNNRQVTADSMAAEINMTDAHSEHDRAFLEMMFSEIFTFYDADGFEEARQSAGYYNLPADFIDRFYDTSELRDSGYAEAMLDILCQYDSSKLYLINRKDNIGYYVASVTLNTVKYDSSFDIVLFIALADSGDEGERVKSIVYYNTK